ncbi:MAG: chitobiase/beta-hexosaminidase C-terminal domain-containing protein [Spirochaetales bacterium]|nr:chitobiase/beta-hexosaminidase C-terminal domain-containing protein [Spirochaetales bacterium]
MISVLFFFSSCSAPENTPSVVVAAPQIVFYEETGIVDISSGTPTAKIYYTLDGSNPTSSSSLFTEALEIEESVLIKAVAYYNGVFSEIKELNIVIEAQDEEVQLTYDYDEDEKFYNDRSYEHMVRPIRTF